MQKGCGFSVIKYKTAYREIVITEHSRPTIGEQYNVIENFYNLFLKLFHQRHK